MAITGQEAHDFLIRAEAKQWDILVGEKDGKPSVSIVEVEFKNKGKTEWYKLGDVLNGYDGYPLHYRDTVFTIQRLSLYRPAFKDPNVARKMYLHGEMNNEKSFISRFIPDFITRASDLKKEVKDLQEKTQNRFKSLKEEIDNLESRIIKDISERDECIDLLLRDTK